MRSFAPLLSSVIPFAICVLVAAAALADDEPPATEWVCPPCGGSCDATIHSAPGRCEQCGMQLVRKQEVRARNVAILVFDGVQIIDYAGPYEVFGQAGFTVFTVSKTGEPITTAMGMRVTPTYALDQAPPAEVIVVPGGHVEDTYVDQEVLDWLRERSTHAAKVMSVCNGAFIMARAGLLDDMRATTFYGLIDDLRTFAPKVEVVADQRFVDNGKVVTTAGLSSGIDGSLHVIGEMLGHGRAQAIALHLEYDWRPESNFARAALADRVLPQLERGPQLAVELARTAGDRDRWEIAWNVSQTSFDLPQIAAYVESWLKDDVGWRLISSDASADRSSARWSFEDGETARWQATSGIETADTDPRRYRVTLSIERSPGPAAGRAAVAGGG